MHLVIFIATAAVQDGEYAALAASLRERALQEFGCLEFMSVCEEGKEVALSWWPSQEHIRRWKADADHQMAQRLGRERWYRDYRVLVADVLRDYRAASTES